MKKGLRLGPDSLENRLFVRRLDLMKKGLRLDYLTDLAEEVSFEGLT